MEVVDDSLIKDIIKEKHENAAHFIHEFFCKHGKGCFCIVPGKTTLAAAILETVARREDPKEDLLYAKSHLNEIPDKPVLVLSA